MAENQRQRDAAPKTLRGAQMKVSVNNCIHT